MTIYFDENFPEHLVTGFSVLQQYEGVKVGLNLEVAYIPKKFHRGIKDEDWIPKLDAKSSFVITQDINLTRRKLEIELYKKHSIGLFIVRGISKKKGLSVWEMVELLSKNWSFIIDTIKRTSTPFAYELKLNGKPNKLQ